MRVYRQNTWDVSSVDDLINPLNDSSLWYNVSVRFLTRSASGKNGSFNNSSDELIIICCVYAVIVLNKIIKCIIHEIQITLEIQIFQSTN